MIKNVNYTSRTAPYLFWAISNAADLVGVITNDASGNQKSFIYRIFLCSGKIVDALSRNAELPSFKRTHTNKLRKALCIGFKKFFRCSFTRQYPDDDIRALYDIVISSGLKMEISPLLDVNAASLLVPYMSCSTVLASFSNYPSFYYFYTFEVKNDFNLNMSAFDVMLSVLFSNNSPLSFKRAVRECILNLLTYADEEGMIIRETDKIKLKKDVNYGSSIVLGSLDRVLTYLSLSIQNDVENKRIDPDNLTILNKLSDYVRGGEVAEKLAFTLLGYLKGKIPSENMCCKMLQTIAHLARGIVDYEKFINCLCPPYTRIQTPIGRAALANICFELTQNPNVPEDFQELLLLCSDLDSFDKKTIDEPDFDKRHAAFSRIYTICENEEKVNLTLLKFVTHVCHNTLYNTKDLSLRTTSGTTIRAIFGLFKLPHEDETRKQELVNNTLVFLTVRGLSSEQAVVRDECVRNLRVLVISFPEHPDLCELQQLIAKNADADFFMNLYHIQVHRRQRALRSLSTQLTEQKTVTLSFRVLNMFLAPIIAPYLLKNSEEGESDTKVALKLYRSIYTLAPWKSYWPIFRMWLLRTEKMEDERKCYVRVLVNIIEAFHFDVADAKDELNPDGSNEEAITIRSILDAEIIPRLQSCINGKGGSDDVHKKARNGESVMQAEKDDVIRTPVALATVKLLLKLPKTYLDQYLHGIILRLSHLMVARSMVVRKHARENTLKVVACLGPQYLSPIIKEIKMIMNKGYQIHVMVFTVHALIESMKDNLSTGVLDNCLEEIMDCIVQDQFGDLSEEKEVGSIRAKTFEAKGNTSPSTMFYLGKYASPSVLGLIINKIRSTLEWKCTRLGITRAANLLSKFAFGMKHNSGVSIETQLILIHSTLTENIEKMERVAESNKTESVSSRVKPQSCLIIPEAPRRIGAIARTSIKSKVHVFVEFALQLLAVLLKEHKLRDYSKSKLEPFVPMILRCLNLKYDLVISHGLDCLYHFLKLGLSNVDTSMTSIIERLFVLLSDYVNLGDAANQASVLLLNSYLFKSFTKIIFQGYESCFTRSHVELLLNYIETDIMDSHKQATAFSLIKAMISRKLKHSRIPVVMRRISELAIVAELPFISRHSRETVCLYVFQHPSCNKNEYLEFFADQLEYEHSGGRKNAAETLYALFDELLPPSLEDTYMYCLTKLGLRLVDETVPEVRKYVSQTLRKLLEAINETMRNDVVEVATEWLQQRKEGARAIGYSIFVELSHVEKVNFVAHMDVLIQNIIKILSCEDVMDMNSERSLTNLMDGLVIIMNNIGVENCKRLVVTEDFYRIFAHLEPLVKCFGSTDTRRSACGFIGMALSIWETPLKLPVMDGLPTVFQLCDWMCWLIKDNLPNEDVSEQASKNIVFMEPSLDKENFETIIETLHNACQFEIMKRHTESIKRQICFKIAAALIMKHGELNERTEFIISKFFHLFVRELCGKSQLTTKTLENLTIEIATVLQNLLGEHEYNTRFAEASKVAAEKKAERVQKMRELAVTNPAEYAALRQLETQKSVRRKKRKLDALKPYRIAKRKAAEERNLRRDD
ncbi:unnamed protein product [Auanema sp. JU1783]|nr:unnamed protein product [Auanema sp. JU1783]